MILIDKIKGFRSRVINALIDAVRAQRPVPGPGILAYETPGGTILRLAPRLLSQAPSRHNFAVTILAGNSVRVNGGHVIFAGYGVATIAEPETIALGGTDVWVYVEVSRSSLTASIDQSWELPLSDAVVLRLPLVHITARKVTAEQYLWRVESICHVGDFHFDMPLR